MSRRASTSDDERPVRRRAPTHPGRILKAHYLEPRHVTQATLAETIGRSEKFVSQFVNGVGTARVDKDLAVKLARVFLTTPDFWLNLQAAVDGWTARQEAKNWSPPRVFRAPRVAAHRLGV